MIEIGAGITVGPGITIGQVVVPNIVVDLVTESNDFLITETGNNFIAEN